MKCLVADPSPLMRRILTNLLRACACEEVVTAADGESALGACDAGITLAIVAGDLPGIDGTELTRKLRENPQTSGLRILLLSPKDARDDVLNAQNAGVDGYILQPFHPEDLRARLERLLAPPDEERKAA